MKPSEFIGWDEIELEDIILRGDIWHGKNLTKPPPEDEGNQDIISASFRGMKLGQLYINHPDEMAFLVLRRNGKVARCAKYMNHLFSNPLPLP